MKAFLKEPFKQEYLSNEEGFKTIRDHMFELEEKIADSKKDEENYISEFNEIKEYAKKGSVFAQDFLGYAFKKGIGNIVPENYPLSMAWLFLSGSNGNDQSIQRLKLFFARSYDQVFDIEDVANVLARNEIYDDNYEFELGKLFCDALVDELHITAEKLFNERTIFQPSTIDLANKFEKLREKTLPRVIEFLTKE